MPRDKNDDEQKERIKKEQSRNEKELKDIIARIKAEYGIAITSAHFRNHKQLALKLKLWNEQDGICLYSGKAIAKGMANKNRKIIKSTVNSTISSNACSKVFLISGNINPA